MKIIILLVVLLLNACTSTTTSTSHRVPAPKGSGKPKTQGSASPPGRSETPPPGRSKEEEEKHKQLVSKIEQETNKAWKQISKLSNLVKKPGLTDTDVKPTLDILGALATDLKQLLPKNANKKNSVKNT